MADIDPAAQLLMDAMEHVKPIDKATEPGDSEIQQFYRDKTLFLTGATGFIGKQLLEKLFRSCEIKKAYILIRPKRGVATEERLREMLNDPVFEPVYKKKPDLGSRIVSVEGDVGEIRLGISDADWDILVKEVEVIFHVAATVRFDEPIRNAAFINVRGTREVLELAKACKKLKSFVHVSTAYCHATSSRVGKEVLEQFYQSPVPPETMLALAETINSDILGNMTASMTNGWPNTYTFTKAISEELVRAESENIPVCVVRPSIVLGTYREPVPGWVDMSSVYGPGGVLLGVGMGLLRVFKVNNKAKISFVPVDFVNNATIAAGWETTVKTTKETKIYNISCTNCGITFSHISEPLTREDTRRVASVTSKSIWYPYLVETNNKVLHWVLSWLLHYIPAYTIDGIIKVFNLKKPQGLKSFIKVYSKLDKINAVYDYFLTNEWNFDDTNLQSLWLRMSSTDKVIYNFDVKTMDWCHHTRMWCLGMRKYVIKDGLKGTNQAYARQMWFKWANYFVFILYAVIFWYILSGLCYIVRCIF